MSEECAEGVAVHCTGCGSRIVVKVCESAFDTKQALAQHLMALKGLDAGFPACDFCQSVRADHAAAQAASNPEAMLRDRGEKLRTAARVCGFSPPVTRRLVLAQGAGPITTAD